MAIAFICECGKQLRAREQFANRRLKCPECGKVLTIPSNVDDKNDLDWLTVAVAEVRTADSVEHTNELPQELPRDLPSISAPASLKSLATLPSLPALEAPTEPPYHGENGMHEFEKTKTRNILALILAIISLRPFVESLNLPHLPLPLTDANVEASHAFSILLLSLALAANFYAFAVIKHEKSALFASADKIALFFYAVSVCLFPFYVIALGSYAAAQDLLGVDFIESHSARAGLFAGAAALVLFLLLLVPFLKGPLAPTQAREAARSRPGGSRLH